MARGQTDGAPVLADPTRGVDIATKQEIYRIIRAEADRGIAVLILSTELPELLGLCDRVLVMVDGSIAAKFDAEGLTEETVMAVAAGAAVGAPWTHSAPPATQTCRTFRGHAGHGWPRARWHRLHRNWFQR